MASGNRIPANEGFTHIKARTKWMNNHDIERTLVWVTTANSLASVVTTEQSMRLVLAINDDFANVQSSYPDFNAGLGMLPLRDPDAA
ncbi:MAG: hypothetical protein RI560_10715 [Natronomonas sp.]|uniref:hypothetical protein n=1 Tax=Natronomonas sp. TaxID=2184060 RepID=UPI00286FE64E|nr:hypothetical protein [Natronomonas sp.]MDR9382123.1 hypothetical protein [Natronomonas sp.]MDR9431601.1 hypothetical protein [Natronomonas sp.]